MTSPPPPPPPPPPSPRPIPIYNITVHQVREATRWRPAKWCAMCLSWTNAVWYARTREKVLAKAQRFVDRKLAEDELRNRTRETVQGERR